MLEEQTSPVPVKNTFFVLVCTCVCAHPCFCESICICMYICGLHQKGLYTCTNAQRQQVYKIRKCTQTAVEKVPLGTFFNNLDVFLCLCVCVCTFVVCTRKSSSWNERHSFPITKISPSVTEPHRNCQHPLTYVYCSTTKPLSICEGLKRSQCYNFLTGSPVNISLDGPPPQMPRLYPP